MLIFTDIILNIFSSVGWDFIDPIQDPVCLNQPYLTHIQTVAPMVM